MTPKDKKIIEDSEAKGIPIFVFTAKDLLSLDLITFYQQMCMKARCPDNHVAGVEDRIQEFREWRAANLDQVKLPD